MAKTTRTPGPGADILRVAIKGLGDTESRVGWFESARYPDGTQVAYVAAVQEFGYAAGGIAPRLGMRETTENKVNDWRTVAEIASRRVLAGDLDPMALSELLGLAAAGDYRKHIAEVTTPALAESTIRARLAKLADGETVGNLDKPLVESGLLLNSLTNVTTTK